MMRRGLPDYEKLESALRAVAYASRLELLHVLRMPKAPGELRIAARQVREGQSAERWMARQSVEEHLQRLSEAGLVVVREGENGRREYALNGPRLYQIMEDFRDIGHVALGIAAVDEETATLESQRASVEVKGPHLVVAHGLTEGRAFPLVKEAADRDATWLVGRRQGIAVSLDYDPYLSNENSAISREGDAFFVSDLPSSRNGTFVNWRELKGGEKRQLQPGDLLGIGRSVLVFRIG